VKQRLVEEGHNVLAPPKETPKWLKFLEELFGNKFSLLLWLGGVLCFIGFALRADQENLYLGIVLFAVVFITGCFSYFQNSKSDDLMKSFKSMAPPQVKVIRGGKLYTVDSADIVRGDIVKMEGGDLVPADCRVLECSDNMVVDNAALTGESEPQKRKPVCTHDDPMETQNLVFFGTSVPEGSCTAVVCRIGDNTLMGQIAGLAMGTENIQTPINKEIQRFIKIISAIALVLGVTFFIIGMVIGTDVIENLVFMIGIIVANVPEGLLATVTVSLTLTAKRMHQKMVLVKNLEGVETLGSTSCICSDKTGTLTQNIMTIAQIVYGQADGFHIEDCESSFTKGNSTYDENSESFKKLCRCATLCNVSQFKEDSKVDSAGNPKPFKKMKVQGDGSTIEVVAWEAVGNASEIAMVKFTQPFRDIEDYRAACPDLFKIPFNSKNKYQVHVHLQEEYGPQGSNEGPRLVVMKGAPERIIDRCSEVMLDGKIFPMTPERKEEIEQQQERLSRNGLRVLGFAERELPLDQFPADYKFNDGKDEGYSTPNFPLGEWKAAEERDAMEKAGETSREQPIHPMSKQGLVFLGLMALIDPPREAVPGAVGKCKTAGIKVVMVTGDHPITAQAIAYKVGILWSKTRGEIEASNKRYNLEPGDANFQDPENAQAIVVPGWEISADMPQDRWDAILEHPQIVFARTSPQQKLIIVENNQRLGHIVAVTGDGVNDSPALKKADIGIAMGIMGSAVSKQAADMILLDDNFASIVSGVEEGRLIFDNLKKSIAYTLTSNIPEITPFLVFIVLQTPLPLSTVLILAIDLGTDMVPAISMSYEEAEADIMRRPPRNAAIDHLVTQKLVIFAYLQIGVMQAAAGFYTWMVVLNDFGYPPNILVGLGAQSYFGQQPLFCKFHGGQYVALDGTIDPVTNPSESPPLPEFPFWDNGAGGYIINCEFPEKFVKLGGGKPQDQLVASDYLQSGVLDETDLAATIAAMEDSQPKGESSFPGIPYEAFQVFAKEKYFPYSPWASRTSQFWDNDWLAWDVTKEELLGGGLGGASDFLYFQYQPAGMYSVCLSTPDGTNAGGTMPAPDGDGASLPSSAQSIVQRAQFVAADLADTPYPMNITACDPDSGSTQEWFLDGTSVKGFKQGIFCNGDGTVPGCEIFDESPYNTFFCNTCEVGCTRVTSADRKAAAGADPDCFGPPGGANCPDWNEDFEMCQDISNRMSQSEALSNAQASYFIAIVVVQWADLLICKTRWLSITTQGLRNSTMNFGLFFETLLAAWLMYCPPINDGLGTRNIRLTHWFPAMPFSIMIFIYDEARKYLMRLTSPEIIDKVTGQARRKPGWLERNTYY
jgi:sodium/potassium-transporting ATPase subunit alpha